jgi:hypothetical protein
VLGRYTILIPSWPDRQTEKEKSSQTLENKELPNSPTDGEQQKETHSDKFKMDGWAYRCDDLTWGE